MPSHDPEVPPVHTVRHQARGVDRRERLLDAAAEVIAVHGWGEASVREIAARAGASMSSLYHFFPDKEALLLALGERYLARIVAASEAWGAPEMVALNLVAFFQRLFAEQRALLASLPGFPAVHDAIARLPAGAEQARRMEAVLIERATALLRVRYPRMVHARWQTVATFTVVVLHAVMERVMRAPEEEATALEDEAVVAMVRYFSGFERP